MKADELPQKLTFLLMLIRAINPLHSPNHGKIIQKLVHQQTKPQAPELILMQYLNAYVVRLKSFFEEEILPSNLYVPPNQGYSTPS